MLNRTLATILVAAKVAGVRAIIFMNTLEEKLMKIENKAKNDKKDEATKALDLKSRTTEALAKVEELEPRITALIAIANKCIQEGIKFPDSSETTKFGYGDGYRSYNFCAEGIHHHVGFMEIKFHGVSEVKYLGFYNGGYCGPWDFYTTGSSSFDMNEASKKKRDASLENINTFLKEFDAFEKAVHAWVDSLFETAKIEETYDGEEICPYCDHVNDFKWDGETMKTTCEKCGKEILLCSMCDRDKHDCAACPYEKQAKRKVLFTDGMSDDFLLIITDAPTADIEAYCRYHNRMVEDGGHFELFAPLKAKYYVKELLDSEVDEKELISTIGHDIIFNFADYHKLFPKVEGYRTVELFAGMTGEFEIISTNAPDSVIKAQLTYINACEENGEVIENPYSVIESMGYVANVLGSHDNFSSDDLERAIIDVSFDYCDF